MDGSKKLKLTHLVYTPLNVAERELWQRWNDVNLLQRIEDFSKGGLPAFFRDRPKAVVARNIATPNMELLHFLNLIHDTDLEPVLVEYSKDIFVPKNPEKYYLGKMFFYGGKGKKGGDKVRAIRVVDFDDSHNRMLCDIKTLWNEPFVDFHHRLLKNMLPGSGLKVIDLSWWVKDNGKKASGFYSNYLSFFVRNGILFENFLLKHEEMKFTEEIVLPAMREIECALGVRPLIVPLCPFANEDDSYWKYYPPEVEILTRAEARLDVAEKSSTRGDGRYLS